ncbi:hypothetical protein [Psychrobacter sp. DM8]|uniref:hypothetical protein n=1 Tax=Psychrobacter sp. DM8 TaxID=3440636 RepID=UPI003F50CDFB
MQEIPIPVLVTPLRIDTVVEPTSRISMVLYTALVIVMLVLAWLAQLSLWQYVLILLVGVLAFGYITLSKPILLHLTQPPLEQRIDRHWQLLLRMGRGDELWQAGLIGAHRYPLLIHFDFMVTSPYQRELCITIFRDQVSLDDWRKLNILASILPNKTN